MLFYDVKTTQVYEMVIKCNFFEARGMLIVGAF